MKRFAFSGALLVALVALPLAAAAKECPPGLAKKSPACVPPGHAQNFYRDDDEDDHDHHRRGTFITDYNYSWLHHPEQYRLPPLGPGQRYYIANDQIYRVDSQTYQILNLIGAVSALMN